MYFVTSIYSNEELVVLFTQQQRGGILVHQLKSEDMLQISIETGSDVCAGYVEMCVEMCFAYRKKNKQEVFHVGIQLKTQIVTLVGPASTQEALLRPEVRDTIKVTNYMVI